LGEQEQQDWFDKLDERFHPFIIWNGKDRVGYVALKDVNNILRSAEFSIFVVPSERNRGYGTTALDLILKYGFGTLNLEVIYSLVFEFNKAIDIYKQAGFTIDGLLRHTCYKNGKYYDSFYISMLKSEYEKSNNIEQKV
jgi:RimJ/RimL family protein N-acetyltransferase